MSKKIVIGVTGASGAIYAKVLLDKLLQKSDKNVDVGLVFSKNATTVWEHELKNDSYNNYPFKIYQPNDFFAPFASGSANYGAMIICPCSMGTMSRIAHGISNDLMTRAADVILKERRKLVLVIRDTPLSLIHIHNMRVITESGGIICPASPSFYSHPATFEELAATVVDRALDLIHYSSDNTYRWGD